MSDNLVVSIEEPTAIDGRLTGGKGSSLAKLFKVLGKDNVPYAIMVTTEFSKVLLNDKNVVELVKKLDEALSKDNEKEAMKISEKIRETIENIKTQPKLLEALEKKIEMMKKRVGRHRVAVRSSGIIEDMATAAFAGQFETYLNVPLDSSVIKYVLKCIGSAFGWRVVDYRQNLRKKKILDLSESELLKRGLISVAVQVMVDSEKAGVAFSIDPDTGNRNVGVIQAVYGLGEMIVQGKETASWTAFMKEPEVKLLGTVPPKSPQKEMLVYDEKRKENITTPAGLRDSRVLTFDEANQVAEHTTKIEKSYGKPMDVEFAIEKGKAWITQARPETVHATRTVLSLFRLKEKPKTDPILTGIPVGTKIASGPVVKAKDHIEAREEVEAYNKKGKKPVLVTSMTTPDWEVVMSLEKVSAIICERGNRTSHAAIVSRERGIPCAVGVTGALNMQDGDIVTLDCSSGEARIYKGEIPFEIQEVELKEIPKTATKVMVNIGSPDEALNTSQLPSQGSSLVRIEFVVSSAELHPVFALRADELGSDRWAKDIKEKYAFINSLSEEYVERLKTGIAIIAGAFYPRKIIVRFSDFKTNEYGSLPGATYYEIKCGCGRSISLKEQKKCPICESDKIEVKKIELEFRENNPMIGFRGASRYVSKLFRDAFNLELKAFVKVHELGLTNAVPMVPFVRTIAEAEMITKDIKEIFKKAGLKIPDIIFMAEIPSICIIPKEFSKYCDGFSIGSNDLTQLTLGIDRDCEVLAWEFDESNLAVVKSIEMLCEGAHSMSPPRTVGICGQAPSDLGRDFIKFLTIHLDSIGVNPDKVVETILQVKEIEDELRKTIKSCGNDYKKVAKELGITEINANYLIKKLSK
ncbi:MAG: PEP/pyruvate-binding domain-containing protein [Candidatus Aenigmarchaeota archaeon]|nr:PEP/pyruvate-binding domain-containing protein [Candidatus Aenigmarchaeota archaeon]